VTVFDRPVGVTARDLLQRRVATLPGLPAPPPGNLQLAQWQEGVRHNLARVLGVSDELRATAADVEWTVTSTTVRDGFTSHHLQYTGALGGTGIAYVLVPDPTPVKAVAGIACLHGHGNMLGKELVSGGGEKGGGSPDEVAAVIAQYGYDFAARLARRGHIVIAPDALGFGERVDDRGAPHHQAMGRVVEYLGYTHTGLRLLDDRRALSVLASWPGVDASRLGAVGLSEGGKRTLFLAAFDDRVRAAVVSGYFTTLRDEVAVWDRLGGWDLCNALPGMLHVADLPDVAALIAPRPLLVQNGRDDPLYDLNAVKKGFACLSRAYAGIGAGDAVALDLFDGGHRFVHDGPEAWLAQWLPPMSASQSEG
jgi:dienelactone hydrolase